MTTWARRIGLMLLGGTVVVGGIATAVPAAAETVPATIVDNAFQPGNITIAQGDALVFTNTGQRQHTVTADDGSFNSGPLTNGQTFSRTFTTPGTFAFFCAFHGGPGGQGQAGTITVTAAAVTTTTTTAAPAPSTTAPAAPGTTVAPAARAPATTPTTTRAATSQPVAATSATTVPGTPLARTGSSWTVSLLLIGAGVLLVGIGATRGAKSPPAG